MFTEQDLAAAENALVKEIQHKAQEYGQHLPADPVLATISSVPAHSRALDSNRYKPSYVSIGTYYWDSIHLRREVEKVWRLCLLIRGGSMGIRLEDLVGNVRKMVQDDKGVQNYYRLHRKDDDLKEFIKMLLLDSCFLADYHCSPLSSSDVSSKGTAEVQQQHDPNHAMVVRDTWYLLKNQMPYAVVEQMCMLTTGRTDAQVRECFVEYARRLLHGQSYISKQCLPQAAGLCPPHSLLHLLHSFLTPEMGHCRKHHSHAAGNKGEEDEAGPLQMGPWRRATEYHRYANVHFVRRKLDDVNALSVLDVALDGDKLLLPRLRVDGNTWTILLNMIELEKHDVSLGTYATAYCLFMSQIACTAEDVKLLMEKDVIEQYFGDPKDVARGFRDICSVLILDINDINRNYLKPIWQKLEKRYRSRKHNLLPCFPLTHRN